MADKSSCAYARPVRDKPAWTCPWPWPFSSLGNTSGVMKMSDTHICLMPYERELQRQADVSAGPSPFSASRMRQSPCCQSRRSIVPVTLDIVAGQEGARMSEVIRGHGRNLGRAELPLMLGRSMLWAGVLPTRLPASEKVMLATKTMRTVSAASCMLLLMSLKCIQGRNPSG